MKRSRIGPKSYAEALEAAQNRPRKIRTPLRSRKELNASVERQGAQKKPYRRSGVKIDPADKWFSLYVRYRDNWTCQRCGTQYEPGSQSIHASHFWGRARESTRFDPVNVVAHCHGCHAFLTANPELHREWKLKQIGQAEYDRLMIRAHLTQKKDRTLMKLIWKQEYEKEKRRFEDSR